MCSDIRLALFYFKKKEMDGKGSSIMKRQITIKPNMNTLPAYTKYAFGFDAVNFGVYGLELGNVDNYELLAEDKGYLGRLRE